MKIYHYGSEGYYAQQAELAQLKKTLIDEAIAARLAAGKIKANEMALYTDVLQEAENSAQYAKEELSKHVAEENKDEEGVI